MNYLNEALFNSVCGSFGSTGNIARMFVEVIGLLAPTRVWVNDKAVGSTEWHLDYIGIRYPLRRKLMLYVPQLGRADGQLERLYSCCMEIF